MKTHTQITVAEFLTEVGRTKFEQVLGHSPPVVTRAKNEGFFSSSWFIGIRNLCAKTGMDCPEHLFKWHVKAEGQKK
jgi:hypothetical protein